MRVEKRENISLLTGCCVSLLVMIAGVILPWFIFQHWNWFWKVLAGVVIGVLAYGAKKTSPLYAHKITPPSHCRMLMH